MCVALCRREGRCSGFESPPRRAFLGNQCTYADGESDRIPQVLLGFSQFPPSPGSGRDRVGGGAGERRGETEGVLQKEAALR